MPTRNPTQKKAKELSSKRTRKGQLQEKDKALHKMAKQLEELKRKLGEQ